MQPLSVCGESERWFGPSEPPHLGPGPRLDAEPISSLDDRIERLLREADAPPARAQLIRALVLLWHDHHDAAHAIAQDIETMDGSYVHGLLHRREPDYANAKYWFHRVGHHPAFPALAGQSGGLLTAQKEDNLLRGLAPGGHWDPFAFIDACESAAAQPASPRAQLLRAIQALEFQVLLRHFG